MLRLRLLTLFFIVVLGLTACSNGTSTAPTPSAQNNSASPTTASGYPASVITTDNSGYPVTNIGPTADSQGYPVEIPLATDKPRFKFDPPPTANMTTVTGQAPPNLSLAIVNITLNGAVLGTGESDVNGNFSIQVSSLPSGYRIGITLSTLEDGKTMQQMTDELIPYRGGQYMSVPNVGVYFETAMVP